MNNILAIDTSFSICSIAVLKENQIIAEQSSVELNMQAEMIATLTEKTLLEANQNLDGINAIVVTIGPGSFTGIRIGVAYANGLYLVLKKRNPVLKFIGVTTMQAMAVQTANNGEYVLMMDAGRKAVYIQKFAGLIPQNDITLIAEEDINSYASNLPIYGNANRLSDSVKSRLQEVIYPSANSVGLYYNSITQTSFANNIIFEPVPIYIREPDAKKSSAFS